MHGRHERRDMYIMIPNIIVIICYATDVVNTEMRRA